MADRIGFNLTFSAAKNNFFDREKVQKQVDAGTKRVLSKFGAYVRQRAKTSIRTRKGISSPGNPPYAHTYVARKRDNPNGKRKKGSKFYLFRNSILFSYDPSSKSVVIGPALLNGSRTNPTVPELLEKGGTVSRDGKTMHYRPRPFMGPAFRKELQGKLAAQLKGFVNKGAA